MGADLLLTWAPVPIYTDGTVISLISRLDFQREYVPSAEGERVLAEVTARVNALPIGDIVDALDDSGHSEVLESLGVGDPDADGLIDAQRDALREKIVDTWRSVHLDPPRDADYLEINGRASVVTGGPSHGEEPSFSYREVGLLGAIYLSDPFGPNPANPGFDPRPGVTLTREQLEAWAGRALADDEVQSLDEAIPNSSIPDAIGVIVDHLNGDPE